MHTFTVDRQKLGTGTLYNPGDGTFCIIGMYLYSCRVPKKDLKEKGYPNKISSKIPEQARWVLKNPLPGNSKLCLKIMDVNDNNRDFSKEEQEKEIIRLFEQVNVKPIFIN